MFKLNAEWAPDKVLVSIFRIQVRNSQGNLIPGTRDEKSDGFWTVVQNSCCLISWKRICNLPQPCQQWILSRFWIFAIPACEKWHLSIS